jgi:AraC family transcriptional regulator of adaptative response/methylated-DNA-[protein]-cysteine methyltransferase
VATTPKGICAIRWGDSDRELEESLAREFAEATLRRDDERLAPWIAAIRNHLLGLQPQVDLPMDVRATAFQRRVWDILRTIPYGATRSYGRVAAAMGKPKAARAVARACASNPAALLIPCHRVVREDGGMGGYRWGVERKRELLARESKADAECEK